MDKDIYTKSQAVAILSQAGTGKVDIFKVISPNDKLFSLTCEQLEKKLLQYIDSYQLAGVVDDPIIHDTVKQ